MKTIVLSLLFVLLYGSGFVATQYGLPFADPVSFLVIRFAITALLLGIICLVVKPKLPTSIKQVIHTLIAGMLIVGTFSLGVFVAIDYGISASTSALIISFQPLLASLLAKLFFKASVSVSQWIGLIIGLIGVIVIVFWGLESPNIMGLLMACLGLLGVACGSVYQKYYCADMNLIFGGFLQSLSSCLLCVTVWLFYPTHAINWTGSFIFSLLWMAIVVSIGALSLLYVLIRYLPISKVSLLFYLVPISALFLSFLFLDGDISMVQGVGIVLVSLSIFMVTLVDQRNQTKLQ